MEWITAGFPAQHPKLFLFIREPRFSVGYPPHPLPIVIWTGLTLLPGFKVGRTQSGKTVTCLHSVTSLATEVWFGNGQKIQARSARLDCGTFTGILGKRFKLR